MGAKEQYLYSSARNYRQGREPRQTKMLGLQWMMKMYPFKKQDLTPYFNVAMSNPELTMGTGMIFARSIFLPYVN